MALFDDARTDSADLAELVNGSGLVTTRYGDNPKKSWKYMENEFDTMLSTLQADGESQITVIVNDLESSGEAQLTTVLAGIQSDGDAAIENFTVNGERAIDDFNSDGQSAINLFNTQAANDLAEFDQALDQYKESRGFNNKGTFADGFTYELPNDVGIDASGNPWIYNGTLPFTVTAGTTPTAPAYTQVTYGTAAQVSMNTSDTVQSFADSFALKIFQSPTDGGLTEIQTRTVNGGEVYEVRKTSDDSLTTIYSDAAGTTEIVQNGTDNISGSDGVVEFYVSDGDYYVEVDGVKSNFATSLKNEFDNVDEAKNYSGIGGLLGGRVHLKDRQAYFEVVLSSVFSGEGVDMDELTSVANPSYGFLYYESDKVSLTALGAVLDGGYGNYSHIYRAIQIAKTDKKSISIGSGVLRIESRGVLSSSNTLDSGLMFQGEGSFNTKIFFDYDDGFAYENTAGQGDKFPTFKDIGFYTRNVTAPNQITESQIRLGGLLKLTSDGEEQGFRFYNCEIAGFNEVFRFEGTNNASETKMFGGSIKRCKNIITLNNEQSLNHEFLSVDVEQYYGNLVTLESGSGGAVKFIGGSTIPFSPTTGVSYLVYSDDNAVSNLSRGPIVFNDVRFELRENSTRICNLKGTQLSASVQFNGGVMFTNADETSNYYISIDDRKKVEFNGTDFAGNTDSNLQAFNYEIVSTAQILNDPATLIFKNCRIPKDTSSNIDFTGNSGVVMADGCMVAERVNTANSTTSDFYRVASPRGAGRAGLQSKRFFASAFAANNAGPTANNIINLDLPANSRVLGLSVFHESGGAVDNAYNIKLTDRGGTNEYCRTTDYSYQNGTMQEVMATSPVTESQLSISSDSGVLTTPAFSGFIYVIYI